MKSVYTVKEIDLHYDRRLVRIFSTRRRALTFAKNTYNVTLADSIRSEKGYVNLGNKVEIENMKVDDDE